MRIERNGLVLSFRPDALEHLTPDELEAVLVTVEAAARGRLEEILEERRRREGTERP